MKIQNTLFLLLVLFVTTGCYGTLRGKVVDAETGMPIEGAVAMAEWTKTKGLGNTYTVSAKVVESVSDKEGNFELGGCYSFFVDKPSLTIYKIGYVAWNNKYIFPDWQKRVGFEWKSGQVFMVNKFKDKYSYIDHQKFVYGAVNDNLENRNKKILLKIYNNFELNNVNNERNEIGGGR